jgi:4-hydroxybenzoate polyprenyltransferase
MWLYHTPRSEQKQASMVKQNPCRKSILLVSFFTLQSPTLFGEWTVLIGLIKTMRPKQWAKNIFVFAPLVFDTKLIVVNYLFQTIVGFILLCVVSGTVYIINDVVDVEKDRQHPRKSKRPIASGKLGAKAAIAAAIIILLIALPAGFILNPIFGGILSGYLFMQILYSLWLKNIVIVDVMIIAAGFMLRVAAGVPLAEAPISPWLYLCMTLLALLIGFGKRRHELTLLKENANAHRQSLQEYNISLLDHVISIVTASIVLAYALYTFSAPNLPKDDAGSSPMMLSIPFLLYAIFRYLYLIHVKGMGGAPEEIIFSDRPLQVSVLLWGLSVIAVLYLPRLIEQLD